MSIGWFQALLGGEGFPQCEATTYDVNAQDVINAMVSLGATVDDTRKGYINTLITDLKNDGIWSELACLQMYCGITDASSLFNWCNRWVFFPTKSGSLTFTANKGYTGAGGHIKTHFTDDLSSLSTLNSVTAFAWNLTNDAQTTALFGVNPTGTGTCATLIQPKRADNSKARSLTLAAAPGIDTTNTIPDASGLWTLQRTSSANWGVWRNGSLIETITRASVSEIMDQDYYVLAQNNNGTAATPSTRQVALFGVGSGNIDVATLYTRLSTYLTNIGAI